MFPLSLLKDSLAKVTSSVKGNIFFKLQLSQVFGGLEVLQMYHVGLYVQTVHESLQGFNS